MESMHIELADKLQSIKYMIDDAYETTRNKYTQTDANYAVISFFMNSRTNGFTRDNSSRENMKSLIYRPNEFYQILLDYAISSFMSNNIPVTITNDELVKYTSDPEGKLDYSGTKPIQVVALAAAMNTYWAINILSTNPTLKSELVVSMVTERYVNNKREQLDNSPKAKMIKVEGYKKIIMMSKSKLNNDIRNMNSDDEYEEYIVPRRPR